jgi:hypothetical protein
MLDAIWLAVLVGLASLVAIAGLLLVPAAILSRFLGRIQTRSPIRQERPRETTQCSRLVTRSTI